MCPEFLIWKNGDKWQVACGNGRYYEGVSGLYNSKKEAVQAVKSSGSQYQIIEGGTLNVLF